MIVFITGGAKNGKSSYAQELAVRLAPAGIDIDDARLTQMHGRPEVHGQRHVRPRVLQRAAGHDRQAGQERRPRRLASRGTRPAR